MMNKGKKKPQGSINQKTQQTEQRGIYPILNGKQASKYLALLVALFPHCLIPPRNHALQQWENWRSLPPFLRAPRWRKESSNPAQIPPLRARFWPREPRILDRIDCWSIYSSKMVRLAHNKSAATGIKSPSFLPVSESVSSAAPPLNLPPLLVTGRNECPASIGFSAAAQASTVGVCQDSTLLLKF